ncbi:unnamed protein product [Dibothriocephalus latus]|uniref:ubiquitinyl hydrolase 1 n=1 Tax=Dibothriocephalus latus TaxID=60516 RepID=A0A3P6V7E5_DIBLA|nr:unnamed protein product [Dibothriocephalus latus]
MVDYFLREFESRNLNRGSRLGSKGAIAKSFADLMKRLWSPDTTENVISPHELKRAIDEHYPEFVGDEQHDAHELMMDLLDVLHEDLNKAQPQHNTELKDAGDRPDEEVAKAVWERFKKRNDSVIVDLFYGMLKLTVVCPTCNCEFRAFDPFASLSLPLDVFLTNALIFSSYKDKLESIDCRIYVPQFCSPETLLPYINLVRQPREHCKYVITTRDKDDLQMVEPGETLQFPMGDYTLVAFEVRIEKEKTNSKTTKSTNGPYTNPEETMRDVLQVINAFLANVGSKEKAELSDKLINKATLISYRALEICNSRQVKHVYDLVAVSKHMGELGSGHYTAYARNRYEDKWYEFDDSFTRPLTEDPLVRPLYFEPC